MKEQLELRDIAPYLPYGVRFDVEITDMHPSAPKETREMYLTTTSIDLCIEIGIPKLRSLSQLTQEIEHEGERFVPIDYLRKKYSIEPIPLIESLSDIHTTYQYSCLGDYIPILEKLYEWHLDINGLIERGLAKELKP